MSRLLDPASTKKTIEVTKSPRRRQQPSALIGPYNNSCSSAKFKLEIRPPATIKEFEPAALAAGLGLSSFYANAIGHGYYSMIQRAQFAGLNLTNQACNTALLQIVGARHSAISVPSRPHWLERVLLSTVLWALPHRKPICLMSPPYAFGFELSSWRR